MPYVVDLNHTRRFPAVLVVENVPLIVCTVPASKFTTPTPTDAGAVNDKLLNTLLPPIVIAVLPRIVKETLLNTGIGPVVLLIKVAPLCAIVIFEVPALKVRFVVVVRLTPASVILLDPRLIVLTEEPEEIRVPPTTLKFPVLKVPCVTVIDAPDPWLKSSPSVSTVAAPVTVIELKSLPADVSVPVPLNVTVLLKVQVIAADNVKLPDIVIGLNPVMVPVNPVQLIERAPAPDPIVTVPAPDAALKNTSSAEVGTEAPPGPPDVADHLVPAVPSQLAVPPTQNLSGIRWSLFFRRWCVHYSEPVV
jgi:hypothetical protein